MRQFNLDIMIMDCRVALLRANARRGFSAFLLITYQFNLETIIVDCRVALKMLLASAHKVISRKCLAITKTAFSLYKNPPATQNRRI